METLINGISVHIEPPGIEWDKTIGNSQIGAGFGIHIRNILDLKLGNVVITLLMLIHIIYLSLP